MNNLKKNKEEFQNKIYPYLIEKGYKPVIIANGKAYDAKDMYFCPQDPKNYMLFITPGLTRLSKKNSYQSRCRTQVKDISDIEKLHEELNSVIIYKDESSLEKIKGCFGLILLLFSIATLLTYIAKSI